MRHGRHKPDRIRPGDHQRLQRQRRGQLKQRRHHRGHGINRRNPAHAVCAGRLQERGNQMSRSQLHECAEARRSPRGRAGAILHMKRLVRCLGVCFELETPCFPHQRKQTRRDTARPPKLNRSVLFTPASPARSKRYRRHRHIRSDRCRLRNPIRTGTDPN